MKQYWITLLKIYLFWMLYFALGRTIFLMVYNYQLANISFIELLQTYRYAFWLDTSTACYLSVLPIIISCIQLGCKKRFLVGLQMGVCGIELLLTSLILFGEIGVYKEWLTKLNYKIFLYLRHPNEIIQTANTKELLLFIVGILILVSLFLFIYYKIVLRPSIARVSNRWLKISFCLIFSSALCFLGMRGGFDEIPITTSSAYFSKHNILNDAAVNPHYNLMMQVYHFGNIDENLFSFMEENQAEHIFKQIHKTNEDNTLSILKKKDINIVLILLESWSADLIDDLTQRTDSITPNFQQLEKEGILFTNMYANGHRSQQAVCSILSGFPSVPIYDITDNQEKYSHLPSFAEKLSKNGFHTSFYFGGNLDYGNIRSFLLHCNFDKILEEKDISKKIPRGKLGVHDQYMAEIHYENLKKQKEPFFSIWFTVSSHSPYDQPKNTPTVQHIECYDLPYLNSAKYCDYWLGKYFEAVRKEAWFDNTLFILVGDHAHPTHLQTNSAMNFTYQRVPMLWLGNVLKEEFRGTKNEDICSHIDLAKTLLVQLDIDNQDFYFGRNIYQPNNLQFAFFEALTGFGWKTPLGECVQYQVNDQKYQIFNGDSIFQDTLRLQGEAFLQYLYKTYLNY